MGHPVYITFYWNNGNVKSSITDLYWYVHVYTVFSVTMKCLKRFDEIYVLIVRSIKVRLFMCCH